MREILESRIGKEIELSFGAGAISGKILQLDNDILHLEKDDQQFFVRIEKIVAVWDSKEKNEKKGKFSGFVSPSQNE